MAERDAQSLQIGLGHMGQGIEIDGIVGEDGRELRKPDPFQPSRYRVIHTLAPGRLSFRFFVGSAGSCRPVGAMGAARVDGLVAEIVLRALSAADGQRCFLTRARMSGFFALSRCSIREPHVSDGLGQAPTPVKETAHWPDTCQAILSCREQAVLLSAAIDLLLCAALRGRADAQGQSRTARWERQQSPGVGRR